jgi:hypothetical protein
MCSILANFFPGCRGRGSLKEACCCMPSQSYICIFGCLRRTYVAVNRCMVQPVKGKFKPTCSSNSSVDSTIGTEGSDGIFIIPLNDCDDPAFDLELRRVAYFFVLPAPILLNVTLLPLAGDEFSVRSSGLMSFVPPRPTWSRAL